MPARKQVFARPVLLLMLLLLMPVVPPLLATGMPSSDDRARGRVPRSGSDYGACRRTLKPC